MFGHFGQPPTNGILPALARAASKLPISAQSQAQTAQAATHFPAVVAKVMEREKGRPLSPNEKAEIAKAAHGPPPWAPAHGIQPGGPPGQQPGGPPMGPPGGHPQNGPPGQQEPSATLVQAITTGFDPTRPAGVPLAPTTQPTLQPASTPVSNGAHPGLTASINGIF